MAEYQFAGAGGAGGSSVDFDKLWENIVGSSDNSAGAGAADTSGQKQDSFSSILAGLGMTNQTTATGPQSPP